MIGPVIEGSTRPIWTFQILQDDNTAFQLTGGVAFAGVLYDRQAVGDVKTLTTGNFAITGATTGTFTYSPVAADVAVKGEWEIEITITVGSQPTVVRDHLTILERYGS